jgi:MFS family permease
MALAADLAPPHLRGAFLGFWTTVGDLGAVIAPIMCGVLADIYGLSGSFYGTAMLVAAGGITTQLFVKETLKKKEKSESIKH